MNMAVFCVAQCHGLWYISVGHRLAGCEAWEICSFISMEKWYIQLLLISRTFPQCFWFMTLHSVVPLNFVKAQNFVGTLSTTFCTDASVLFRVQFVLLVCLFVKDSRSQCHKIGEQGLQVFEKDIAEDHTALYMYYRCKTAVLEVRSPSQMKSFSATSEMNE